MASADAQRRRNLAKGTAVRQARAALKRALAAGDADPREVVAGHPEHEDVAGPMPLEQLLKACGYDAVDVLSRGGCLELRKYRTHTLPRDRRREIAALLEAS